VANRTFRDDLAIAVLPLVWEARLRAAASQYLNDEQLRSQSATEAYALADAMLAARVGAAEDGFTGAGAPA
jgi:hypothetical protein